MLRCRTGAGSLAFKNAKLGACYLCLKYKVEGYRHYNVSKVNIFEQVNKTSKLDEEFSEKRNQRVAGIKKKTTDANTYKKQ